MVEQIHDEFAVNWLNFALSNKIELQEEDDDVKETEDFRYGNDWGANGRGPQQREREGWKTEHEDVQREGVFEFINVSDDDHHNI